MCRSLALRRIFWTEKGFLLIDFLQSYAVIWITAQPWPWPPLWIRGTQWTVSFNLDVFSLSSQGSLNGRSSNSSISIWGQMNGYLSYAVGYCAFAVLFYGTYLYVTTKLIWLHGSRYDLSIPYIWNLLIIMGYFFYVPLLLVLSRLFYCDSEANMLSADSSVSCSSTSYWLCVLLTSALSLPFLIGFPLLLQSHISNYMWQASNKEHELEMQSMELSYILDINTDWWTQNISILTPLSLSGRYFYSHLLVYKSLLVVSFVALRFSFPVQSAVMWSPTFMMLIYYGVYSPPFRCCSTNRIFAVLWIMLVVSLSFGVANAFQVSNAFTVASVETIFLVTTFCIGIASMIAVCIQSIMSSSQMYPTILLYQRLIHEYESQKNLFEWVCALQRASKTSSKVYLSFNSATMLPLTSQP